MQGLYGAMNTRALETYDGPRGSAHVVAAASAISLSGLLLEVARSGSGRPHLRLLSARRSGAGAGRSGRNQGVESESGPRTKWTAWDSLVIERWLFLSSSATHRIRGAGVRAKGWSLWNAAATQNRDVMHMMSDVK